MANPLLVRRAAGYARRLWPLALAAKRHWDNLSDEEKERYRRRARDYAQRGRKAVDDARRRRGGGRGRR
jgi:hypothetical protein